MIRRVLYSFTYNLAVLCCCIVVAACDSESQYSTQYSCNFYFDTAKHPTSILTRSLDNPGMWTFVTVQLKQGVNHVIVNVNNGEPDEDIAMTTEIENHRVNYNNLGAGNGIIVGHSNFNGIKAYDRMCPYCLNGGKRSQLQWDADKQKVGCPSCCMVYMLETGNCTTESLRLLEYKVAYAGTGMPLQVYN